MKIFGKMSSLAALSLSALLGLGSFALLAQTSPTDGGQSEKQTVKRERQPGKGKSGKNRRGGQRHGRMMFEKLNLSEDQKSQLKQLRQASRESSKPVMEQLRAKRQDLRQANNDGTFDETLATQKLTEMAALQAKMMGEKAKLRQAMTAVLTPEQKTQMEQSRAQRKAKWSDRKNKRGAKSGTQDN